MMSCQNASMPKSKFSKSNWVPARWQVREHPSRSSTRCLVFVRSSFLCLPKSDSILRTRTASKSRKFVSFVKGILPPREGKPVSPWKGGLWHIVLEHPYCFPHPLLCSHVGTPGLIMMCGDSERNLWEGFLCQLKWRRMGFLVKSQLHAPECEVSLQPQRVKRITIAPHDSNQLKQPKQQQRKPSHKGVSQGEEVQSWLQREETSGYQHEARATERHISCVLGQSYKSLSKRLLICQSVSWSVSLLEEGRHLTSVLQKSIKNGARWMWVWHRRATKWVRAFLRQIHPFQVLEKIRIIQQQ